mgnify:FL=1
MTDVELLVDLQRLFEEPDTLEQVAEQASKWFQTYLNQVE